MYDLRFTIYDLQIMRSGAAGIWCLTPPMYEVQHARRPQAAARQLLMYDLRRTMYDLNASAPEARENGRRRGKCVWTARMRCPKG